MESDYGYKKGQLVLVTQCNYGHGVGEKEFLCVCGLVGQEINLGERIGDTNVYSIRGGSKLILPDEFKCSNKKV